MGAWTTETSLNLLVQSLESLEDQNVALMHIIQVIEMVVLKGCKPAELTLEGVFKMSSALGNAEVYTRIENLCRNRELVETSKLDAWKNIHEAPVPTAPLSADDADDHSGDSGAGI